MQVNHCLKVRIFARCIRRVSVWEDEKSIRKRFLSLGIRAILRKKNKRQGKKERKVIYLVPSRCAEHIFQKFRFFLVAITPAASVIYLHNVCVCEHFLVQWVVKLYERVPLILYVHIYVHKYICTWGFSHRNRRIFQTKKPLEFVANSCFRNYGNLVSMRIDGSVLYLFLIHSFMHKCWECDWKLRSSKPIGEPFLYQKCPINFVIYSSLVYLCMLRKCELFLSHTTRKIHNGTSAMASLVSSDFYTSLLDFIGKTKVFPGLERAFSIFRHAFFSLARIMYYTCSNYKKIPCPVLCQRI